MSMTIEVLYDDGKINYFPEPAIAASFGESVLDDICIRFDADIENEGLIVELRHHSPMRPAEDDFDYEPDSRGFPCQPHADAWTILITPEEAAHVLAIYYKDTLIFKRIGTALVNLFRIAHLSKMYFDDGDNMAIFLKIAALYHFFEDQRRRTLANAIKSIGDSTNEHDAISKMLGLPPDVVQGALDYELFIQNSLDEENNVEPSGESYYYPNS